MSPEFLLTALVVTATPGTGVLYTLAAALTRGRRAGVVAAFAGTLGIVPHMAAAITGLAAVLYAGSLVFEVVKYAGVVYLLYLAWRTVRDRSPLVVDEGAAPRSTGRVILDGVLINLLNPKLTLFFFAFLPQFVTPGRPGTVLEMLGLSAVFMAMTFVVFTVYAMFAAAVRGQVISRPAVVRWMRRCFAATYVLLAGRLALEQR